MKPALPFASRLLLLLHLSIGVGQSEDAPQQLTGEEILMQHPTCSLDEKALEERKNTLFRTLKERATKAEKKEEGYAFTLPRREDEFQLVTSMILLESECCPFFSFDISATAGSGDLIFTVTAPTSAQDFLGAIFGSESEQRAADQLPPGPSERSTVNP
ncbi:MAG: hypothetical protein AAF191_01515 [Verrucomicrobiota bacterium]